MIFVWNEIYVEQNFWFPASSKKNYRFSYIEISKHMIFRFSKYMFPNTKITCLSKWKRNWFVISVYLNKAIQFNRQFVPPPPNTQFQNRISLPNIKNFLKGFVGKIHPLRFLYSVNFMGWPKRLGDSFWQRPSVILENLLFIIQFFNFGRYRKHLNSLILYQKTSLILKNTK